MSNNPKKINLRKKAPAPTAPSTLTYDQFVALIKTPACAGYLSKYLDQQKEEDTHNKLKSSSHVTRTMFVVGDTDFCGLCLSGMTTDTDEYDDGCTLYFYYEPATTDAQKETLVAALEKAAKVVNTRTYWKDPVHIYFEMEQGKLALKCSEMNMPIVLPPCRLRIKKNDE